MKSVRYDRINRLKTKHEQDVEKIRNELSDITDERDKMKTTLDGVMHEVRKFNKSLSASAEELSILCHGTSLKIDVKTIQDLSERILNTSGLIRSRLVFADFELNPSSFEGQATVRNGIYKKFDKARHILSRSIADKKLQIVFEGNSKYELDAVDAFEMLPFILLENAVKYSTNSQTITVKFDEKLNDYLTVSVSSYGPHVQDSELSKVFDRGFRSKYAEKSKVDGEGLGLFYVKLLCDLYGINIEVSSDQRQTQLGDSCYSNFNVTLFFNLK